MQRKLDSWKKQGYNVNEFSIQNKSKKENVRDKAGSFKKQGYGV